MARFLNTIGKTNLAVAVCGRCNRKVANADLQRDPDSRLMVCSGCVDAPDPWRLPMRVPDRVSLPFVQADTPIDNLPGGAPRTPPGPPPDTPPDTPPGPTPGGSSPGDFGPDFGKDFS